MANFVIDNTPLPPQKTDAYPPTGLSTELDAADINSLWSAAGDLRTQTQSWRHVASYGAVGDGTDETAKLQAAITANPASALILDGTKTYTITSPLDLGGASGLRIIGYGATVTSSAAEVFVFNSDASNVSVLSLKMVSTLVSASGFSGLIRSFNKNLTNIRVNDCEFTAPTAATNGIKTDNSTAGTALIGLEVSDCRFINVGQIGVEVINHTFDDVSRYEQVRIQRNRFDGTGVSSAFGMAVSFSGMGKNNVFSNNTIQNAKTNVIEFIGPWNTVAANNVLRKLGTGGSTGTVGLYSAKPNLATQKPQGVAFIGNIVEGTTGGAADFGVQINGLQDGVVSGNIVTGTGKVDIEICDFMAMSGNVFDVTQAVTLAGMTNLNASGNIFASRTNTAGYNPAITNVTLSQFTGNTFLSERSTGLLVNGTSAGNVFVGNLFSNENSPSAGPPLQFDGASVTGNVVVASVFRRTAAGGTTWQQTTSAAGNIVALPTANTVNPAAADTYTTPLTLPQGSNGWLHTVKVGGAFFFQDGNTRLRMKAGAPTGQYDGVPMAPGRVVPTYGPSVAIDAGLGSQYVITATNGTAFTVANPTNAVTGQRITIQIRNTSGGALGAVTWDTAYKLSAWTSPATANSRAIDFQFDGSLWVEMSRTTADVPN